MPVTRSQDTLQPPLVLMVTGYLGTPVTTASALQDAGRRHAATREALTALRARAGTVPILLAFTGDRGALQHLIAECGWPQADAAWFDQSSEDLPFGKGLLEHRLLQRALAHWALPEQGARVVKLTAKYTVENLADVLAAARRSRLPLFGWRHVGKPWIDSRCFHFEAREYADFEQELSRIDDRRGYYMEQALFDAMRRRALRPGWLRHRPLVSGLSGSTDVQTRLSPLKRLLVKVASAGWRAA